MQMQAFHTWLFSSSPTPRYLHCLLSLTHLSCRQLRDAAAASTWDIWNADIPAATA